MRLDSYLAEKRYAESRSRAKRLILAGAVSVGGRILKDPAFDVCGEPEISVEKERFVGRGGEKLSAALDLFSVDAAGAFALDIGASTGGFTDCLLQRGAAHVTALDVGEGQLHPRLRADARVRCVEKYNARALSKDDLGVFSLAVMDVSFISQTLILPRIPEVLTDGGVLISLVKPQFEAGRAALGKGGIVRLPRDRARALGTVVDFAATCGLSCFGLAPSPILGGDGNEEFLAAFRKSGEPRPVAAEAVAKTVLEKKVILL